MFLLILATGCYVQAAEEEHLHSNMFLLIRFPAQSLLFVILHLHSNMFLLILLPQRSQVLIVISSTFQYVSINSRNPYIQRLSRLVSTFQYVSINSRYLIFLIFPTFSLLFLSTLDSICVFPLYSHLKIIIYLLFMPLSMSPVFYFIEHRQFYNFIFLTAYAISFNFLNVYSYFSTYQQTHCNIIKLQLRIIFFILNRL